METAYTPPLGFAALTQASGDGMLPPLIEEAGFEGVTVRDSFKTATGRIEIIRAEKPGVAGLAP